MYKEKKIFFLICIVKILKDDTKMVYYGCKEKG